MQTTLRKSLSQQWGVHVTVTSESKAFISSIADGSVFSYSCLSVGDELISANGKRFYVMTPNQINSYLNTCNLLHLSYISPNSPNPSRAHVRNNSSVVMDLVSSDEEEELPPVTFAVPRSQSSTSVKDFNRKRDRTASDSSQRVKIKIERPCVGFGEANVGDEVVEVLPLHATTDNSASNLNNSMSSDNVMLDENDDIMEVSMPDSLMGLADMPHQRETCSLFKFQYPPTQSTENNAKHCAMCYCYVCDKLASECNSWAIGSRHCNATLRVADWKRMKTTKSKQAATSMLQFSSHSSTAATNYSGTSSSRINHSQYAALLSVSQFNAFVMKYPFPTTPNARFQAVERYTVTLFSVTVADRSFGQVVSGIDCGNCVYLTMLLCDLLQPVFSSYRSSFTDVLQKCLVVMLYERCPAEARAYLMAALASHQHPSVVSMYPVFRGIFTNLYEQESFISWINASWEMKSTMRELFGPTVGKITNEFSNFSWIYGNGLLSDSANKTEPSETFVAMMNDLSIGFFLMDVLSVLNEESMMILCQSCKNEIFRFTYCVKLLHAPRPNIARIEQILFTITEWQHAMTLNSITYHVFRPSTQADDAEELDKLVRQGEVNSHIEFCLPKLIGQVSLLNVAVLIRMLLRHPLLTSERLSIIGSGDVNLRDFVLSMIRYLFSQVFVVESDIGILLHDRMKNMANFASQPAVDWSLPRNSDVVRNLLLGIGHVAVKQLALCLLLLHVGPEHSVLSDSRFCTQLLLAGAKRINVVYNLELCRCKVLFHLVTIFGSVKLGNSFFERMFSKYSVYLLQDCPKVLLESWVTGTGLGDPSSVCWYPSKDCIGGERLGDTDVAVDFPLLLTVIRAFIADENFKSVLDLSKDLFLVRLGWKSLVFHIIWGTPSVKFSICASDVLSAVFSDPGYGLAAIPPLSLLFRLGLSGAFSPGDLVAFYREIKQLMPCLGPETDSAHDNDESVARTKFWLRILNNHFSFLESSKSNLHASLFFEQTVSAGNSLNMLQKGQEIYRLQELCCISHWKEGDIINPSTYAKYVGPAFREIFRRLPCNFNDTLAYTKGLPVSYECKPCFLDGIFTHAIEDLLACCVLTGQTMCYENTQSMFILLEYSAARMRSTESIAAKVAWLSAKSTAVVTKGTVDYRLFNYLPLAYFDELPLLLKRLQEGKQRFSAGEVCDIMHAASFSTNLGDVVKILDYLNSAYIGQIEDGSKKDNKFLSWLNFLDDANANVENRCRERLLAIYPTASKENCTSFIAGVLEFSISRKPTRFVIHLLYTLAHQKTTVDEREILENSVINSRWARIVDMLVSRYDTWASTLAPIDLLYVACRYFGTSMVRLAVGTFVNSVSYDNESCLSLVDKLHSMAVVFYAYRKLLLSLSLLIIVNTNSHSLDWGSVKDNWEKIPMKDRGDDIYDCLAMDTMEFNQMKDSVIFYELLVNRDSEHPLSSSDDAALNDCQLVVDATLAIEPMTIRQLVYALNVIMSPNTEHYWLLDSACGGAGDVDIHIIGDRWKSPLTQFPLLRVKIMQYLWKPLSPQLFLSAVNSELSMLIPLVQSNGNSNGQYRAVIRMLFNCLSSIEMSVTTIVDILPRLTPFLTDAHLLLELTDTTDFWDIPDNNDYVLAKDKLFSEKLRTSFIFLNNDEAPCFFLRRLSMWFLQCFSLSCELSPSDTIQFRDACNTLSQLLLPSSEVSIDIPNTESADNAPAPSSMIYADRMRKTLKEIKAFLCCCLNFSCDSVFNLCQVSNPPVNRSVSSTVVTPTLTGSTTVTTTVHTTAAYFPREAPETDKCMVDLLLYYTINMVKSKENAYFFHCIDTMFQLAEKTTDRFWASTNVLESYVVMIKSQNLLPRYIFDSVSRHGEPASLLFQPVVYGIIEQHPLSEKTWEFIDALNSGLNLSYLSVLSDINAFGDVKYFGAGDPPREAEKWFKLMNRIILTKLQTVGCDVRFRVKAVELLILQFCRRNDRTILPSPESFRILDLLFTSTTEMEFKVGAIRCMMDMYVEPNSGLKARLVAFIVENSPVFEFMVKEYPVNWLIEVRAHQDNIVALWTEVFKGRKDLDVALACAGIRELTYKLQSLFNFVAAARSTAGTRSKLESLLSKVVAIFIMCSSEEMWNELIFTSTQTVFKKKKFEKTLLWSLVIPLSVDTRK